MIRSGAGHSVFYRHFEPNLCIYLVVYVDDIVITGNDQDGITNLKQHLFQHFQTKDLGRLKYFLGIEVTQSSLGIVVSQRKYALDILEETGMMGCRPIDTPMDPNAKLLPGQGDPLSDPGRYRRLVGKLNYLIVTRPDISFPVLLNGWLRIYRRQRREQELMQYEVIEEIIYGLESGILFGCYLFSYTLSLACLDNRSSVFPQGRPTNSELLEQFTGLEDYGGTPYNSTIPRAIWNPSLTPRPSPQPKFAARVGVSDSDMPKGTRPVYNPYLGI
ncbi:hypothetical protein FXO38_13745 [Capsicum annuum]|nr:hypothetical protein FXO38_13745 [Capsicum annuum]KAF3659746.1 hypothetical protein FXO37_13842 [Capsicum annuum]